jgi:hypothetical protein
MNFRRRRRRRGKEEEKKIKKKGKKALSSEELESFLCGFASILGGFLRDEQWKRE